MQARFLPAARRPLRSAVAVAVAGATLDLAFTEPLDPAPP